MIIKFAANELNFELTTDAGEKIVNVEVSEYSVEINTAELPTLQNELLAVVKQLMTNISAAKSE